MKKKIYTIIAISFIFSVTSLFAQESKQSTSAKEIFTSFGGTVESKNIIVNGGVGVDFSVFDKIGYYTPDAPIEDHWLMLQISKYAKMKYIDDILFSYRWHSTNTMKNKEKMEGTYARLPERSELSSEIDESLIVEFYNRKD